MVILSKGVPHKKTMGLPGLPGLWILGNSSSAMTACEELLGVFIYRKLVVEICDGF